MRWCAAGNRSRCCWRRCAPATACACWAWCAPWLHPFPCVCCFGAGSLNRKDQGSLAAARACTRPLPFWCLLLWICSYTFPCHVLLSKSNRHNLLRQVMAKRRVQRGEADARKYVSMQVRLPVTARGPRVCLSTTSQRRGGVHPAGLEPGGAALMSPCSSCMALPRSHFCHIFSKSKLKITKRSTESTY